MFVRMAGCVVGGNCARFCNCLRGLSPLAIRSFSGRNKLRPSHLGDSPFGSRLGSSSYLCSEGHVPVRPDGTGAHVFGSSACVRTPRAEGGAGTLRAGPTLAWGRLASVGLGFVEALTRGSASHTGITSSQASCRWKGVEGI
mgnify:CR=1 FL=1